MVNTRQDTLFWGSAGSQSSKAEHEGQGCGTHLQKALVQGLLGDVQHFRVVNAAIVKYLLDHQPEGERGDVQHVEQGGFTGTHFVSSLDKLHIALKKSGKGMNTRRQSPVHQSTSNTDSGTGEQMSITNMLHIQLRK